MTAAELTAESTSKFVDAKGVRVHCNEAGEGHVVIMLHGAGAGASGWSNFNRNIGPFSAGFRAILLDQPGYGQTDNVESAEAPSEMMARVIRDFMDALNIETASFIGNSMGAATCLNFAIDYPERTGKLVLMGSATGARQSMFVPTPTEGQKALGRARQDPSVENLRNLFNLMVYDASFVTDELLQQRSEAALANKRPVPATPPAERDLTRELGSVKAPCLVVWGRDDRVVPLDGSLRLLWGLPDAQLHVYSKCGHWAQFEHADEFNRLVLDFFSHD